MPRPLDPSTLTRGGGLAARKSVEASSFVHQTQGLDGLVAHVIDPSRAHMAATIGLVDAGGLYTSDEVEGALQELAGAHADTHQSGVYSGGTFTSVGLTVTLATPTVVLIGGTERDMSGDDIPLVDNSTSWLYVNGTTGALTSTTGAAPSVTSPENVLLAQIVTFGGVVTSSRDARWFVRNVERKLPFTVRGSGTAADRNSEAAFESIDAAILYLETFGSSVMRNFTLVIKGALTVSSSVVIPVDGVTLQGEDGCVLTTGASLAPMINVSSRSNIRIRDITFMAAHAASTAIGAPSGGAVTNVQVERCTFASGASQWVTGVDFNVAGPQTRVFVRDCHVTAATYGIRFREPVDSRIIDTVIVETGGAGTLGFHLGREGGAVGTTADSLARGVTVRGFATGGFVRGTRMRVTESAFVDSDTGFDVGVDSEDVTFAQSSVLLDATNGEQGVVLQGSNIRVTNVDVRNQRDPASYTAETPTGIHVVIGTNDVILSNCRVDNFLNTVTPGGYGITFGGTSTGGIVEGCTVSTADVGFDASGTVSHQRVEGCVFTDVRIGLSVRGDTLVDGVKISLDASRGLRGIDVLESDVSITNCQIVNPRLAASYGAGPVPYGISIITADRVSVTNTDIRGFYNDTDQTGIGVATAGSCSDLTVTGGKIETAQQGILFEVGSNRVVSGVSILDTAVSVVVDGDNNLITGCSLITSSTIGTTGIDVVGDDTTVTGCSILCTRVVFAGEVPRAVRVQGENTKVTGCLIRGWRDSGGAPPAGFACSIEAGSSQVTFADNTVEACWDGVLTAAATADEVVVANNTFNGLDASAISLSDSNRVLITGNLIVDGGGSNGVYVENGTDVTISSNNIQGEETTAVGISVLGTDTVANRVRRVVVSNNTVVSVTADGILLDGYVQDVTIAGNVVDCYLPADVYDPTALACIRMTTATTSLVKRAVVSDNVCARAQNGIVVSGVSAANSVDGLTICDNVIHHCAVGSGSTTPCAGIDVMWARNAVVRDNTLSRIGKGITDADVEGDPTAGANVSPFGIRLRNCTSTSVLGNLCSNLSAAGAGVSTGISSTATDTVLAFDAVGLSVSSNQVVAEAAFTATGFGIVVESGQASGGSGAATTLTGASISNNVVRKVEFPAISLLARGGATLQQGSVTGNVVSSALDAGIFVQTVVGTTLADGILREVSLVGNTVGDAGGNGIYVLNEDGCTMTAIAIKGNMVSDVGDHGVVLVADATPAAFNGIMVLDNTISGATSEAIRLAVTNFDPADVTVSNNTVTGANGTAAINAGIAISTEGTSANVNTLSRLVMSGNRIHTNGAVGISIDLEGALVDAVITGNQVTVDAGAPPLSIILDTIATVAVETYSENILLTSNTFAGGTVIPILVDHGQKIRNFTFAQNVRRDSADEGVSFEVLNATVGTGDAAYGIAFSNNTFDACDGTPLQILLGDAAVVDDSSNLCVVGNRFNVCNTLGVTNCNVLVRTHGRVNNLDVSGNQFQAGGTLDSASGVVELQLGSAGLTHTVENIRVADNTFNECVGPAIYVTDNTAATSWSLSGLAISGNQVFDETFSAIYVDLTAFTSVQSVDIAGNSIDTVSGAGSNGGIVVLTPTATTVDRLRIADNQIRFTGAGAAGALYVVVAEDITNLAINHNIIEGDLATQGSIYVSLAGRWQGGGIQGNTLSNGAATGIYVNVAASIVGITGLYGVNILDNILRAAGTHGIDVDASTGTSTPELHNVRVSGNQIEDATTYGIVIRALSGTLINEMTLSDNIIRGTGSRSLYITTSGSNDTRNLMVTNNTIYDAGEHGIVYTGTLTTGDLFNLRVSHNNIYGAEEHGIAVICTTMGLFGVAVTDNLVADWGKAGGTSDHGGIYMSVDEIYDTTVTGNVVRTTETYAIGYWIVCPGSTHVFTCSNNLAQLGDAANTESLRFDSGAGADQLGLSFTGNSFRGAATGVNYAGSSFAPDRSICAHNVERTTGGAGAWATFAVAPPWSANCIVTPNQD